MSLVWPENDTDGGQLIASCVHENQDVTRAGTALDTEGMVELV